MVVFAVNLVRADEEKDAPEKDSITGAYQIWNANQLYWFAGLLNGTRTKINESGYEVTVESDSKAYSAKAVLMTDIVVNEEVLNVDGSLAKEASELLSWIPIRNVLESETGYSGTFDGQGYTISGLYCVTESNPTGLFGYIESSGSVKNVAIKDSYFNSSGGLIGSICGQFGKSR